MDSRCSSVARPESSGSACVLRRFLVLRMPSEVVFQVKGRVEQCMVELLAAVYKRSCHRL